MTAPGAGAVMAVVKLEVTVLEMEVTV